MGSVCAECGNDSGTNDDCIACLLHRDGVVSERARIIARLRQEARRLEAMGYGHVVPGSNEDMAAHEMIATAKTLRRMADLLESEVLP